MIKLSLHQHDRGKERLNLSPSSVDSLQKAVDQMWFSGGHKKLPEDYYYSQIRGPHRKLLGYAAFKRINQDGKRPRLILSTILNSGMKPRGSNISHFFDHSIRDNQIKLEVPERFKGLPKVPNNIAR